MFQFLLEYKYPFFLHRPNGQLDWALHSNVYRNAPLILIHILPNITGTVTGDGFNNANAIYWSGTGALSAYKVTNESGNIAQYSGSSATPNRSRIELNASWINSIYGASENVTPENYAVQYFIKY